MAVRTMVIFMFVTINYSVNQLSNGYLLFTDEE